MEVVWLYIVTAIVFFGLDVPGLRFLVKPVFERDVGALLAERVRIGPAAGFYAAYVAGIVYFASWPALVDAQPSKAFINGMILGALAYGTYEFTNLATLRGWTWRMVALDLAWGTVLTGVSAFAGVTILRLIA